MADNPTPVLRTSTGVVAAQKPQKLRLPPILEEGPNRFRDLFLSGRHPEVLIGKAVEQVRKDPDSLAELFRLCPQGGVVPSSEEKRGEEERNGMALVQSYAALTLRELAISEHEPKKRAKIIDQLCVLASSSVLPHVRGNVYDMLSHLFSHEASVQIKKAIAITLAGASNSEQDRHMKMLAQNRLRDATKDLVATLQDKTASPEDRNAALETINELLLKERDPYRRKVLLEAMCNSATSETNLAVRGLARILLGSVVKSGSDAESEMAANALLDSAYP